MVSSAVLATLAGFETVQHPALNRALVAVVIAACLAVTAVRAPRLAVLLTFGFLVFLGFLRRFLIPVSGWTSYDPLLLVAPLVGGVLLVGLFIADRRQLADGLVAKLVFALLLLTLLEAVNPQSGRLLAGLAGLLFLAAPLVWFFIGRKVPDRPLVSTLLWAVIGLGVVAALYGLVQGLLGLFPWDAAWVDQAGYRSLRVQGVIRPFGTFASNAEFATYVGIALVLSVAMLLRRRWVGLLAVPVLAWALLLDSTRALFVLAVLAVIVLLGLQLRQAGQAAAAITGGVLLTVVVFGVTGPALESAANRTGNPLIAHQVSGLLHPLDPNQSTLTLYATTVFFGLQFGLANPLGAGTAATNSAGAKVAEPGLVTETDIGNAFVALGLLGGVLLLVVIVATLCRVIILYWQFREPVTLGVVGLLIVTLGQWLNGAHYAVAPLVWFLVGWIDHQWARRPTDDDD
jgi:hypothetical protein